MGVRPFSHDTPTTTTMNPAIILLACVVTLAFAGPVLDGKQDTGVKGADHDDHDHEHHAHHADEGLIHLIHREVQEMVDHTPGLTSDKCRMECNEMFGFESMAVDSAVQKQIDADIDDMCEHACDCDVDKVCPHAPGEHPTKPPMVSSTMMTTT